MFQVLRNGPVGAGYGEYGLYEPFTWPAVTCTSARAGFLIDDKNKSSNRVSCVYCKGGLKLNQITTTVRLADRRAIGWLIAASLLVIILVLIGRYYWVENLSPSAQARQTAHQFWLAVDAGDVEAISAMLAVEADFVAVDVIEENSGLRYGGIPGDHPPGHVIWVNGPSMTGAEVIVNSLVRHPVTGQGFSRSLAMKRVDGLWKVTRQGPSFSF